MTQEQTRLMNNLTTMVLNENTSLKTLKVLNGVEGECKSFANELAWKEWDETYPSLFRKGEMVTSHYFKGICIQIREVYRANGTNENKSFRVNIMKWDKYTGNSIYGTKLSQNDSLLKQERVIRDVVDKYMALVKEGSY